MSKSLILRTAVFLAAHVVLVASVFALSGGSVEPGGVEIAAVTQND